MALFFEHTGFFALFLGGTTLCLLGATYGAATDMSYGSLYWDRFRHARESNSSVAVTLSMIAAMIGATPVLIAFMPPVSDVNVAFSAMLALVDLILALIGGSLRTRSGRGDRRLVASLSPLARS